MSNVTKKTNVIEFLQIHPARERAIKERTAALLNELSGITKVRQLNESTGKFVSKTITVPLPDEIRAKEIQTELTKLAYETGLESYGVPIRIESDETDMVVLKDLVTKFIVSMAFRKQAGLPGVPLNFAQKVVLRINGRFQNLGKLNTFVNWALVREAIGNVCVGQNSLKLDDFSDENLMALSMATTPTIKSDDTDKISEALLMAKKHLETIRKERKALN